MSKVGLLNALRPIACVAALNATVQAVVAVVLDVLALCLSFCALGSTPQQHDNDFFQYLTYYLQGSGCGSSADYALYTGTTEPSALRIWLVLSVLFGLGTLVSSVALVIAVGKQWSDERLQVTLTSWLFTSLFSQIYDLVFGYIIGSDFFTSQVTENHKDNVGPLTLGFVFFLVIRGGYLWLLNLAFLVYLFSAARALHQYLNEQLHSKEHDPIESWPTLDDFNNAKGQNIEIAPAANNPRYYGERVENGGQGLRYPEHSARARWPSLNEQAQNVRSPRPERPSGPEVRKVKSTRDSKIQRQNGVDNPAFEEENRYYLRLHNDVGSSKDYDDTPNPGAQQWAFPSQQQGRGSREVREFAVQGHYKRMEAPRPVQEETNGVSIPPVDYMDTQDDPIASSSPRTSARILSLQEAILDRTLRLKKVPEELKRGIERY